MRSANPLHFHTRAASYVYDTYVSYFQQSPYREGETTIVLYNVCVTCSTRQDDTRKERRTDKALV